jgi:hypothetical protein
MQSIIRHPTGWDEHEPNVLAWNDDCNRFFWGDHNDSKTWWPGGDHSQVPAEITSCPPEYDTYPYGGEWGGSQHYNRTSTGCCPGKLTSVPTTYDNFGQITNADLQQRSRYSREASLWDTVTLSDDKSIVVKNTHWEAPVKRIQYAKQDELSVTRMSDWSGPWADVNSYEHESDLYYGAKGREFSRPGALVTTRKIVGCESEEPVFETETKYYQNSTNDWTPIGTGLLTWTAKESFGGCEQLIDFKEVGPDYYFRMPGPPGGCTIATIPTMYRMTYQRSFYGIEALIAETEYLRHYEQVGPSEQFYVDVLEKIMFAIKPAHLEGVQAGLLHDQGMGYTPPIFGETECDCPGHDCCPSPTSADNDFYLKLSYVRSGCTCDTNDDPFTDMLDKDSVIEKVFKIDGSATNENMVWVDTLLADTISGQPQLSSEWYSSYCPDANGNFEEGKGGCADSTDTFNQLITDLKHYVTNIAPGFGMPKHDACYKLLSAEKCTKVKPIQFPEDSVQTAVHAWGNGEVSSEHNLLAYGFTKYNADFSTCCASTSRTVYDYRVQTHYVGLCRDVSDEEPRGHIDWVPQEATEEEGTVGFKIWTSTDATLGSKFWWDASRCTLHSFTAAGIANKSSSDSLANFSLWTTTDAGRNVCYQSYDNVAGTLEHIDGTRDNTFSIHLGLGLEQSAEDYIAEHWSEGKPYIADEDGGVWNGLTNHSMDSRTCCEKSIRCVEQTNHDGRECQEVSVYKKDEPECVLYNMSDSMNQFVEPLYWLQGGKMSYYVCGLDEDGHPVALSAEPRPDGCSGTTEYCTDSTEYCLDEGGDTETHLEIPCEYLNPEHFPTSVNTEDFCGEDSVCTPEPEPSPFPVPTPHYDPTDVVYDQDGAGFGVIFEDWGHPFDATPAAADLRHNYYMGDSPYLNENIGTYGEAGAIGTVCKKLISYYTVDEDEVWTVDMGDQSKLDAEGNRKYGKKFYRGIFAIVAHQVWTDFRTTTDIVDSQDPSKSWNFSKFSSANPPTGAWDKFMWTEETRQRWFERRIAAVDAACVLVQQDDLAPTFGAECDCTTNSSAEEITGDPVCTGAKDDQYWLNVNVNSPQCCVDDKPSYGEIFPRKTDSYYFWIDGSSETFEDNRTWKTAISRGAIGTTCQKVRHVFPQGPIENDPFLGSFDNQKTEQDLVAMGFHLNITSPNQSFNDNCCFAIEQNNPSGYWRYPVKISTIDTCTYGYRDGIEHEEIPYDDGVTEYWAAPFGTNYGSPQDDYQASNLSNLVFYEHDTCRKFEIGNPEGPFDPCGNKDIGIVPDHILGDHQVDDLQWYINGGRCLVDPTGDKSSILGEQSMVLSFQATWGVEPPTLGPTYDQESANFEYRKCCKIQNVCESGECKPAMLNVFGEDGLPLPCCDYQGTENHPEDRYASCDDPVNCIPPTITETTDYTDKPCECPNEHYSESGGDSDSLEEGEVTHLALLPMCDDCVEIEETPAPPSVDITLAENVLRDKDAYTAGKETVELRIEYNTNFDSREHQLHIAVLNTAGNMIHGEMPDNVKVGQHENSGYNTSADVQEDSTTLADKVIAYVGDYQPITTQTPFSQAEASASSMLDVSGYGGASGNGDPHICTFFGEKYDM